MPVPAYFPNATDDPNHEEQKYGNKELHSDSGLLEFEFGIIIAIGI